MFADALALTLLPGPPELTVFSPPCQAELHRFHARLRVDGTVVEAVTFRTADGTGLTGEFVIPLAQAPGPALPEVAISWLDGGAGRTLRIRIGGVEAAARTPEAVTQLLQQTRTFQTIQTRPTGSAPAHD
ncbi:hypothetical protein SAMN02787142_7795 [Burkholderia sp. WP9]|uniref:hypothetical protein n=1 Tax=Burkholderia sp. WP9 TaxID=1500263 RepID=UPI000896EB3F|nr:hypothetical protein [Burkholderia sp. WP9]SEF11916.1 hypothetical protein SAMN02787142_7795 [Burkholderia sp. WP9]